MRDQQLFINGAWVAGIDTFEVRDPFDATLVGTVAVASADQAAQAVSAAKAAMLAGWLPAQRADLLLRTDQPAEARDAFARAAELDTEQQTDAQQRVDELDGLLIEFDDSPSPDD